MRVRRLTIAAALGCCGCWTDRPDSQTVPPDTVPAGIRTSAMMQANTEACTRVYSMGQRVLASNPELPQRVSFLAVGTPGPEIFHQGTTSIVVTQKLVEMCKTDADLAAVLCLELGKMIAEREALMPPEAREPLPHPPIDAVRFRGDDGLANPDAARLRELAHYESEQRRQSGKPYLPDPAELARGYLHKSGFTPDVLEKAKPILRAAADHSDLESKMNSGSRGSPFAPPGG